MDAAEWARDFIASVQTFEPGEIIVICGLIQCPCCRELHDDVTLEQRNTSYVNDQLNWLVACGDCHRGDDEYYAELWADHYASRF